MADDQNELRSVNWPEVLSFTHIFKSFRMAIHPSKMLLALTAILLIYFAGRAMDRVWCFTGATVYTSAAAGGGEVSDYFVKSTTAFDTDKEKLRENRPSRVAALWATAVEQKNSLGRWLAELGSAPGKYRHLAAAAGDILREANQKNPPKGPDRADILKKSEEDWADAMGEAADVFGAEVDRIEAILDQAYDKAKEAIKTDAGLDNDEKKSEARSTLSRHWQTGLQALTRRRADFSREKKAIYGEGIFGALIAYEGTCLKNAIAAVREGNVLGGWAAYRRHIRNTKQIAPAGGWPATTNPPAAPPNDSPGVIVNLLMGAYGLCWLVSQHWLYAIIFGVIALSVWALFGGAMHRISALHAAREEKISIAQALKFSSGKFLSFFTAPLLPLSLILALGIFLMIGGLLANLWGFGAILVGILFFLAILLGLVIAFLVIGLVAGFPLMYPTISVEGSDSFDAFSRSFAYVFQRPWRLGLYGIVAVVHGTICYLFVRTFAYVALAATHHFAQWGIWSGGDTLAPGANKMDVLWQAPTFDALHGPMNWEAMSGMEAFGGILIAFWVYLVVGLVAAFLLSYFSSASTMIYYLLRRKVDATDLDDVYVEEDEGELLGDEAPGEEEPAPAAEADAPAEDAAEEKEAKDDA